VSLSSHSESRTSRPSASTKVKLARVTAEARAQQLAKPRDSRHPLEVRNEDQRRVTIGQPVKHGFGKTDSPHATSKAHR
jgi:hypothetical protein